MIQSNQAGISSSGGRRGLGVIVGLAGYFASFGPAMAFARGGHGWENLQIIYLPVIILPTHYLPFLVLKIMLFKYAFACGMEDAG
jgi:hypothetical protein